MLDGAAEGQRELFARLREVAVVGPLAVRAPMALVSACGGVEHDDPMVDVTVGDIKLVGGGVDDDIGRGTEIFGVVAATALPRVTDLPQEPALAGKLKNVRVLVAAGAEPHVILLIHVDAVLELRPFIALCRSAPRREERTVAVKLKDRRRGAPDRSRLVRLQRGRPVDDPYVIAPIYRDADDRADDPVVRQRLGPCRVDTKHRHALRLAPGLVRHLGQDRNSPAGHANSDGKDHPAHVVKHRQQTSKYGVASCRPFGPP
jgi:hypothetical protein